LLEGRHAIATEAPDGGVQEFAHHSTGEEVGEPGSCADALEPHGEGAGDVAGLRREQENVAGRLPEDGVVETLSIGHWADVLFDGPVTIMCTANAKLCRESM
jgi:hypothetical protein